MTLPQVPEAGKGEAPEGVITEQEAPEGVVQQGEADSVAELKADLASLRTATEEKEQEYERNISRLTSTYDKKLANLTTDSDVRARELEDQYHAAQTAGMDELERATYEKDVAEKRLDEAGSRIVSLEQQTQGQQLMTEYVQSFIAAGVDPATLNASSLDSLIASGWAGILGNQKTSAAKIVELEAKLSGKVPADAVGEDAGDEKPPRVAGVEPGAAPVGNDDVNDWGPTIEAAKSKLGRESITVMEVFDYVNRGLLPKSILPGMEGYPDEG